MAINPRKAQIICVTNQKGGVGKTTTTVNLAASLALKGKKVLVVDMDPQGNTTSGFGVYKGQIENSIYEVLTGSSLASQAIQSIQMDKSAHLDLLPATADLSAVEVELVGEDLREYVLKKALASVAANYEYVFIDSPPSLGLLTINCLVAANYFLVPLQCEYYALEGLSQLLNTASLIQKNFNPSLELRGIALTMFDGRNKLSHQVEGNVRGHFKDKVFKTVIPRNVRVSEAPSHGKSAVTYAPDSTGAQSYLRLSEELSQSVGTVV